MKQESWITGHVHAYRYFGGVTRILTPDNLKAGVLRNSRTETVLNKSYQEMAEHYGTAILPARPRSPKDKRLWKALSALFQPGYWLHCATGSFCPWQS